MFIHTRTFRLPAMTKLRPHPTADMNPADAAALGIRQGDKIKISTKQAAIEVTANLTDMVMAGVVHMYHGYPDANVNQLIENNYLDPISGFPGFKAVSCNIEKIAGSSNKS
jgi:anaerobic selenocysteine-containing dehydrogenase